MFFFSSSHDSWDSSVGATEKLSRLKRTERTVRKAGTGWRRTTEACSMGVPEEPMRIEIGSGRIQWRGVSQRSCPTGTRPFSLPYVEEKIILHIFGDLTSFFFSRVWGGGGGGVQETGFWGDSGTPCGGNSHPAVRSRWMTSTSAAGWRDNTNIGGLGNPQGCVTQQNLFLYVHFKPCREQG